MKRPRVEYGDRAQQSFTLVVSLSRCSQHHKLETVP